MGPHWFVLLGFSFLGICLAPGQRAIGEETCQPISYISSTYDSGGKHISVEIYEPTAEGRFPVLIFIHGAGGVISRSQHGGLPDTDNLGERQAACSGYVVILPHYFESSGQAAVLDRSVMATSSKLWLDTLEDSIDYALTLRKVDSRRVFLHGESLGGYLAISLAATDPRVKAVSVFGSGAPPGVSLRGLPPVLIQRGEADDVVPLADAKHLAKELERLHVPFELAIYPRLGHYSNSEIQKQLVSRTLKFFRDCVTHKATPLDL